MKLFCVSDTHGQHEKIELPEKGECDVFVFAGDFTARNSYNEFPRFATWLRDVARPLFSHMILIAGNHDECFQNPLDATYEEDPFIGIVFKLAVKHSLKQFSIHCLQDSGVTIDGVKFWGSPWTPPFCNWSFMLPPEEIAKKWEMIPDDTDVLITHGPPFGTLDAVPEGDGYRLCGDKELAKRVFHMKLKAHVFGHIHEGYGQTDAMGSDTHFANCSFVNGNYKPVNKPIIITI